MTGLASSITSGPTKLTDCQEAGMSVCPKDPRVIWTAAAARVLEVMLEAVRPGVTPVELNDLGATEMRGLGAQSAPTGARHVRALPDGRTLVTGFFPPGGAELSSP